MNILLYCGGNFHARRLCYYRMKRSVFLFIPNLIGKCFGAMLKSKNIRLQSHSDRCGRGYVLFRVLYLESLALTVS